MEIATNAVLAALLVQASAFVKDLELPIQTPLELSKVRAFNVMVIWSGEGPELACYLGYGKGYEFRHHDGHIASYNTLDSYTRVQNPDELVRFLGEAKYAEAECLQRARGAIRRLGYSNVTFIADAPKVIAPSFTEGGRKIPRFIFKWLAKGPKRFADEEVEAQVEVNSSDLHIENFILYSQEFWRKGWPVTFGTTNVYEEPDPAEPTRADLEVRDVSRDFALAFIRRILPETSDFCAKLGPPIPSRIEEADIVMGGSQVAIKQGRLSASLRLKSGHLVVFHAGHVWAVHARDVSYNHPARRKYWKGSPEDRDPVRVTKEEAAQKVHQVLVEKLKLPEKRLFLDHDPVFDFVIDPAETKGPRRYSFHWQPPETEEERQERKRNQILPEISVSAEVDAVSGEIKAINFMDKSLERPDPGVDIPRN